MRQGNDVGTTYRSTIYAYTQEQLDQALCSKDEYQKVSLNHPFISLPSIYKHPQVISLWISGSKLVWLQNPDITLDIKCQKQKCP